MKNTTNSSSLVYGLILAGGKSSRMGFDKGTIDYHGKPQREYLMDLLGKYCSKVFTSCKSEKNLPENLHPLVDQFPIDSPLNGILSAFQFNKDSTWFTVPVDMPMIDETMIEYLIEHRDPSKAATCFFDSDGKNPEPLFTLWEPSTYEALMAFYRSGKISPRDFLKQSDIKLIAAPNNQSLLNINSKEEWDLFKKIKINSRKE